MLSFAFGEIYADRHGQTPAHRVFPARSITRPPRRDRREPIFEDDTDGDAFLAVQGRTLPRFDGCALAYCLMGNHYHLVLHTRRANLSRIMRDINGIYTQAYNRRHGSVQIYLGEGAFV